MSKWNQELWLKNIKTIIKKSGKTAKDVETAIGANVGYISRIKTGRNNTVSAEFLVNSAEYLDTDIDTLLTIDLAQKENESCFIIKTIDKLIGTVKKSDWKNWGESDLRFKINDGVSTDELKATMPLIQFNGKGNYPFIKSKFHPNLPVPLKDDHFILDLTEDQSIVLLYIEIDDKPEYEMYLTSPGYANPLCHTCDDNDINTKLAQLFEKISLKIYTQPTISQNTMDIIEALLFKK